MASDYALSFAGDGGTLQEGLVLFVDRHDKIEKTASACDGG